MSYNGMLKLLFMYTTSFKNRAFGIKLQVCLFCKLSYRAEIFSISLQTWNNQIIEQKNSLFLISAGFSGD